MTRTIHLELRPDQEAALQTIADQRGVSVAELINEGVDRLLEEWSAQVPEANRDPILGIIGLFEGDTADVSAEHDRHLAELQFEDHSR